MPESFNNNGQNGTRVVLKRMRTTISARRRVHAMKFRKFFFVLAINCLMLPGCSLTSHFSSDRGVVAPTSPNCLGHLLRGREYVAAERYELAREQYLMALAASDDTNKDMIARELHSVDLMIKSRR